MAGLTRRFGRIAALLVLLLAAACPNPMLELIKQKVERAESPDKALTANFSVDKTSGEIPLTVKFTDESANTGDNPSWKWYFDLDGDDSLTSAEQNPSHTYSVPGKYTVKLVVSDAVGEDEETKNNLISVTSKAPTVDITNPKNEDFIKGTVEILAAASDDLGVVRVEFYIDGVLTSSDSAAPYEYTWDTSGLDGPYALKAMAYDEEDRTGTDDDTTVTVDNIAPTVNITSPLDGSSVGGSSTTIMASAADNDQVARVEFYIGEDLKHTDPDTPFTFNWDTQSSGDGTHSLKAKAYDRAGNEASDDDTSVTVDNALPSVNITAPLHGAHVRGLTEITASAIDTDGVVKVEFYVNGALLATDTSSPYSAAWDTTAAANGAYELMARSYDAANNDAVDNDTTVTVDNTAPTTNLTAPATGAVVRGAVSLTASASDNTGVSRVEFYVDGAATPIATDTSSPYSATWDTTAYSNTAHTLQAKAYDQAGNDTTDDDTSVTVDNSAPTVDVTAPADGAAVRGTVSVTADASDNRGVTKVEFYLNSSLKSTDTTSPYSYTWDTTTYSNTTYAVIAKAYDQAGNDTTDDDTSVTVDNIPPTVNVTAPANGAAVRSVVTITATASDSQGVSKVEFYVDSSATPIATDSSSPYSCSWDTSGYSNASHTLQAKAYDAAGNVTTDNDTSVTVDNSLPTVNITAPANGTTVAGVVAVTANASDNHGVTKVEFYVDGSLQSTDTTSPYSYSWDTRRLDDGSYALMAKAFDAAGNNISDDDTTVSVDNISFVTKSVGANGGSIAINGTQVYIAYRSSNRIYLAKSTDGGSIFNTTEVPIGGAVCTYSLAMDVYYEALTGFTYVSIAYDNYGTSLRFIQSTDGGGTWSTPVTIASDSPRFIRMAKTSYRPDDHTYLVILLTYIDDDSGSLVFMSKEGGADWLTTILESTESPTNPQLDASGSWAAITYGKVSNPSLNYRQSSNRGGSWATAVQLVPAWNGFFHDISLNSYGPSICYDSASSGETLNIKYSANNGATWQTDTVNSSSASNYYYNAVGEGSDYRVAYVYNNKLMIGSSNDRADWYYSYEIDAASSTNTLEMICNGNTAYIIYGGKFAKVTYNY